MMSQAELATSPRRWAALAVLCCAVTVVFVDSTILDVAAPFIQREMSAPVAQIQWAIDAYIVVYAALLFPAGNLADRFGRRRFLVIGAVIFAIGSLMAMFATDMNWLIAGRIVMGIGGSIGLPTSLSLISQIFPTEERGKAIGIWGAVSAIGILIGPIVAAVLMAHFWWGSIFLVNIPLLVITVVGAYALIPESRDTDAGRSDRVGSVASVFAMLGVIYAIIEGPHRGWGDAIVVVAGVVGVLACVVFVYSAKRAAVPVLDLTVFQSPVVLDSSMVMLCGFIGLAGSAFAISQYIQFWQHRSVMVVALLFMAETIGWAATSPFASKIAARAGYFRTIGLGSLFVGMAYAGMAVGGSVHSLHIVIGGMLVLGLGLGVVITVVTDTVMGGIAEERSGMSSALNDAARQVGSAIGVAVIGGIIATATAPSHVYVDRYRVAMVVCGLATLLPVTWMVRRKHRAAWRALDDASVAA